MFDQSRPPATARRAAGATIASVVVHGLVVLLIAVLVARQTNQIPINAPPRPTATVVFLDAGGPGGGGGGSPNPAPSKPVEIPRTKPREQIPVDVPPAMVTPPPPPALSVPIMTPDSTSFQATGTSSVSLAPYGGGGRGRGLGPGRGDGIGEGVGGNVGGDVARGGAGLEWPTLLRDSEPNYTGEALRAKIQGQVELQAIVLEDGSVGDVVVVKSLDRAYGLDIEAIKAARQWRFRPARQNGKPVRIAITMFLDFRIN